MQLGILLVWAGAFRLFCGLLYTAAKALWRGRLSEARSSRSGAPGGTLEPRGSDTGGFRLQSNWPGLAMIGLGALLLLAGALV